MIPVAILAGGLATRMWPLTEKIPKSLLEVAGRPFVVWQVERLAQSGLTDLVFCVGFLGNQIEEVLGDGSRWGVKIRYSYDGPALLGTGGALRRAVPLLGDRFLILYGDSYLPCDYATVAQAFLAAGKLGLMTVFRNQGRWDQSNVIFRDGRILRYDKRERTPHMEYIDYGLGGLQGEALVPYPPNRPFDLVTVYQDLLARDQLAGYEVRERFYEIGSPAGLAETQEYLAAQGEGRK